MKELGFSEGMIPNNAIAKFNEVFMSNSFLRGNTIESLVNYAKLYNEHSPWAQKWEKASYANSVIK